MNRRSIAVLLTLTMVFSLLPVTTLAASGDRQVMEMEYGTIINPLYASTDTLGYIVPPALLSDGEDTAEPVYLTSSDAVIDEIREKLKSRTESFTIYYQTDTALEQEDLENYFHAAMEHTGIPTEGDYLKWHYRYSSYGMGSYQIDTAHYYEFSFTVGYHTDAQQEAAVDEAIAALRKELALDTRSDYMTIKAVYDWICSNVTYDYSDSAVKHSAYSALINRTSVCQGYATLLYRLLLEEGIDCRVISGDTDGDGFSDHGWNIVKLNGQYYNVDSTWDAEQNRYYWFLLAPDTFYDHPNFSDQHIRDAEFDTEAFHTAYPMAAEDYVYSPTYVDQGVSGDLSWTLDEEGVLTVTGSGEMTDNWKYDTRIKYVILSSGITSICEEAFFGCSNLYAIQIPSSVTSIGAYAFTNCTNLVSLHIPNGVEIIDDYTLQGCTSLINVSIPSTVTTIGNCVFWGCSGLSEISIPQNVTSIGRYAFYRCSGLTSITLPEGLTSISPCQFEYCTGLTNITIPESVTTIESYAFDGCTSLTSVTFTGDAPEFKSSAFKDVTADVYYPAHNDTWTTSVMQDYGGTLTWVPDGCASGHTVVTDPAVVSTCIETGLSEGQHCSVCGETLVAQETLPLADHTLAINPYVSPTCTEVGYFEGRYCSVCDEVLIEQFEIPAQGHDWSDWNTTTEATETAPGEQVRTCSRCPETETKSIPATGQTEAPTEPPAVENTPTEPPAEEDTPTEPPAEEDTPIQNPFIDVYTTDYYFDSVLWAVKENVTTGMTATTFEPNGICTRGQVVTFLWRTAGSPEPTSDNNPFVDVTAADYFYKAVLWAIEEGITTGTSATTFTPNDPCTRGQVATFLWRAEDEPAHSGNNIFIDLGAGAYYYDAVLWAVEKGITNGMGNGLFAPHTTCTRGQIVTFLYRAMA